jgi:nucleotide-binding universal stress UspA family protein
MAASSGQIEKVIDPSVLAVRLASPVVPLSVVQGMLPGGALAGIRSQHVFASRVSRRSAHASQQLPGGPHGLARTRSAGVASTLGAMRSCLVLGYDRTDAARAAARWAADRLRPSGKLVIVHASRSLHVPPLPTTEPERRRCGQALVDELLLGDEDALLDVEVEVEILDSDPVSALTDTASRHRAEAIVVGTERHSRMRAAIGTVTIELLKASTVPVVVVPGPASR